MTDPELEARVRPDWYTKHPSGVECIDIIEHLPCNFANAVKYLWRCGLKPTEKPIRELMSARWYTDREEKRRRWYCLQDTCDSPTSVVWHGLVERVIESEPDSSVLGEYLSALMAQDFIEMIVILDEAIARLK